MQTSIDNSNGKSTWATIPNTFIKKVLGILSAQLA